MCTKVLRCTRDRVNAGLTGGYSLYSTHLHSIYSICSTHNCTVGGYRRGFSLITGHLHEKFRYINLAFFSSQNLQMEEYMYT